MDDTKTSSAVDTLARTLWGEARSEGVEGMVAVAWVVMNRVKIGGWWGETVEEVCRKNRQFSCWNPDDPNRAKLLTVDENDREFATAKVIAMLAIKKLLVDFTGGATHYHTIAVAPSWAKGHKSSFRWKNHVFYTGIK